MENSVNNAGKPRGRPFVKGVCANPKGKPKGALNKTTKLAMQLLETDIHDLVQRAIAGAKAGDTALLMFLIDKIIPKKTGPIQVEVTKDVGIDFSKMSMAQLEKMDKALALIGECADQPEGDHE